MRKAEVSCEKLRQENFLLPCDESCEVKAQERRLEEELAKKEQDAVDEERKRIEMEEFARKYGTKAPKKRKQRPNIEEGGRDWKKVSMIAAAVLVPVIGGLVYLMMDL